MAFTSTEVAQAISRANGQKLNQIKNGSLNAQSESTLGKTRNIKIQGSNPYAKLTGHTFAHVASFSKGSINNDVKLAAQKSFAEKSMWIDRRTVVAAATEMMNSALVAPKVALFTTGPVPSGPERVQAIPLSDDYWGYEAGVDYSRKVETGTIIFYIVGGTLFITSCYPETFVAGPIGLRDDNYALGDLFA